MLVRVFFAPNSRYSIVRPDDGLRRLAAEAEDAAEIEIVGFTDSSGSDAANLALAYGRAETIREILIKRGVAAEKIAITTGARPPNGAETSSEAARALNRRAEVTLIKRPNG
jgi:outer membrane protein OmpA-like peptidoglycan-associated protein